MDEQKEREITVKLVEIDSDEETGPERKTTRKQGRRKRQRANRRKGRYAAALERNPYLGMLSEMDQEMHLLVGTKRKREEEDQYCSSPEH